MKCESCNGEGWIVEPEHSHHCNTETGCDVKCPVPVQVKCKACNGYNKEDEILAEQTLEEAGQEGLI